MNTAEPMVSAVKEMVLVDDDKLTLEIVSWIVRKTSFVAHLFADHEEALVHVSKNPPKLLVVDYYMPGITGIDFVEQLNADDTLSDTTIFLCSAVAPRGLSQDLLTQLNLQTLEKSVICDKKLLNDLLDKYLG